MSGTPRARRIASVGALTLATWLHGGYSFGTWPQLFPLEHILKLDGALTGDWYTSHAAPHWVFDHLLALLPTGALAPASAVLWVAGVALFWTGFAALADDLGLPEGALVAAGLIGARTAFAGFGSVSLLTPYLYPSSLACAGWLFALYQALRGRAAPAGIAAGLAMLAHPQIGVLALLSVGPTLARTARARGAIVFAGVTLLVGGLALARLVLDLGLREPIPARERFELLALVRLPHHLIYRAFRPEEYAMVALWGIALIVALVQLRRGAPALAGVLAGWPALLVALAALCGAGALASSLGRPLALVELQTARASAWVPLLAVLAAAAAIARGGFGSGASATSAAAAIARDGGTPGAPTVRILVLFAVPLLAEVLWLPARPVLAALGLEALPRHALQAVVLTGLAAGVPLAPGPLLSRRVALSAAAALVVAGFAASGWHGPPRARIDPDWRDIAGQARQRSGPTDLFLTPPDLDGFRFYSHRPIVVDFGEVAHDDLRGWRKRIEDVTGDPGVLAPGLDPAVRGRRMAEGYDRAVLRSPEVARRYGVRFVVMRRGPGGETPAWAETIALNRTYVLLRVRGGPRAGARR